MYCKRKERATSIETRYMYYSHLCVKMTYILSQLSEREILFGNFFHLAWIRYFIQITMELFLFYVTDLLKTCVNKKYKEIQLSYLSFNLDNFHFQQEEPKSVVYIYINRISYLLYLSTSSYFLFYYINYDTINLRQIQRK